MAGLAAATVLFLAPAARADEPAAVSARSPSSRASTTQGVGALTAVAGGVFVVAGVGTGFAAKARERAGWSTCRRGSGQRPECPASARDDFRAARRLAAATNVLLIGGGLVAVAGLGLVIFDSESRARDRQVVARLELAPALDRAGVSLTGAF